MQNERQNILRKSVQEAQDTGRDGGLWRFSFMPEGYSATVKTQPSGL